MLQKTVNGSACLYSYQSKHKILKELRPHNETKWYILFYCPLLQTFKPTKIIILIVTIAHLAKCLKHGNAKVMPKTYVSILLFSILLFYFLFYFNLSSSPLGQLCLPLLPSSNSSRIARFKIKI